MKPIRKSIVVWILAAMVLAVVWWASLRAARIIGSKGTALRLQDQRDLPLQRVLAAALSELEKGNAATATDILGKAQGVLDGTHPFRSIREEMDGILLDASSPNPRIEADAATPSEGDTSDSK